LGTGIGVAGAVVTATVGALITGYLLRAAALRSPKG